MVEVMVVVAERAGMELDELLCLERPALNKGFFRRNIRDGVITVDGAEILPNHRVQEGEVVIMNFDQDTLYPRALHAPSVKLEVIFENDDIIVANKPAGVASEPERWAAESGSMAGAFLAHALGHEPVNDEDEDSLEWRPRLLHRLDKDTSGVLVAAKNLDAERVLRTAFEGAAKTGAHDIEKTYLALVEGEWPHDDEVLLDGAIGPEETLGRRERRRLGITTKARKNANRMTVLPDDKKDAKAARTRVTVEQRFRGFTMVRCSPETGRTHQIRVHLAHAGFPLAVDTLYGRLDDLKLSDIKSRYRPKPGRPERPLIDRLTLHALEIDLPDPSEDGKRLVVQASLPADFQRITRQLAKVRPYKT
ncbi:MAG: RluA family pseudouridine synthase [Planctomycetota bacterium]|nr:RluA family pseudouridine synthase [Planctomycetota bacterium]MDG2142970.1 RluA family pseudouridine synthase [Planctomycetota bacterium]